MKGSVAQYFRGGQTSLKWLWGLLRCLDNDLMGDLGWFRIRASLDFLLMKDI